MPAAPIAKGVIIMCAVLIAAGYTVYENREQVKELVDKTRRKISEAMHSFADEIMPSETQRQRQPMSFGGRPESTSLRPSRANSRSRRNSADSANLRGDAEKAEGTSRDNYMADSALRYRPQYQRGFDSDTENATRNPFDDENRVLFDAAAESSPQHIVRRAPSESSGTVSAMSEKGVPFAEDVPALIPAVLPVPTVENTSSQEPELPSHTLQNTTNEEPQEEEEEEEEEEGEEEQTTFSTSQPYWAIQQWTVDVSTEEPENAAVESVQGESATVSVIDSDEGEDDMEDRVEIASDIASSMGDSWSEVGSTFSAEDRM